MTVKQELRAKAHHLKPVVMIGQHGLTPGVLAEIEVAINTHELIKIKIAENDRDLRKAMIAQIVEETGAQLIQTIGKVAVIYRENTD